VNALVSAVGNGPYILGERFSAADVVLGGAIRWLMLFKLIPDKPEFASYVERITARPAFKRALEKDEALARELAS
jgi:glutathione S-transferase